MNSSILNSFTIFPESMAIYKDIIKKAIVKTNKTETYFIQLQKLIFGISS